MSCNQAKMRWWWLPWCTCCVQGGLPCAAALRPWNRSCDPSPVWGRPCSLPMARMEASTMYQMKHDVLDHTHADVRALFNAWLADSINLMQQTKEVYWKVQETMCTALHTLFDGIVDAAGESLDLLAERVMHLGGPA